MPENCGGCFAKTGLYFDKIILKFVKVIKLAVNHFDPMLEIQNAVDQAQVLLVHVCDKRCTPTKEINYQGDELPDS